MRRTIVTLGLLLVGGHAHAADAGPATLPAYKWGQLVDTSAAPKRVTADSPLSDQANAGGWVLREEMSDEFDGPSLDTSKWKLGARAWKGRPPTFFHPANVSVDGGELILRINRHPAGEALPEGYTHTSGFIHSRERVLYGYVEAELRLMDAPWVSGFWMTYGTKEWSTEIDICENCPGTEGRSHDLNSNLHVFRSPPEEGGVTEHQSSSQRYKVPFDLRDDYHTWGLEWDEEHIRFYIDGVLFRESANEHWRQPLVINLNNETNKWFGALPDDERTEEDYRVRYVRVWKKAGE